MDAIRQPRQPGRGITRPRVWAMGWPMFTVLNVAISLVTVITISWFEFSRPAPPLVATTRVEQRENTAAPNGLFSSSESLSNDLTKIRVESFASVAPAEFYEILLRATPEQIAALAMQFNQLPINSRTGGALGMFFQAWAELDGKAALAGACQIRDAQLKRSAINTVIHSMSAMIAPDAATFLRNYHDPTLPSDFRNECMDAAISRWADLDPAGAAMFFEQSDLSNNPLAANTRNNIAWAWGTIDPEAALAWIQSQSNSEYSENLFDSVLTGWSRNDAAAAMAYVAGHLDRPGATDALASVVIEVFNRDPITAANWLRQLPNGDALFNAEQRLASAWASKDPAAAAQWVQQLPLDDQTAALLTVARLWAVQDWDGTRTWLNSLSGDARDVAVSGAVTYTSVPPTETLPIAMSIVNREARIHTVQDIVASWAATDRDAAASWVQGSGLTREEKQELLGLDIFSPRSQP
jgi:hypothetical protein